MVERRLSLLAKATEDPSPPLLTDEQSDRMAPLQIADPPLRFAARILRLLSVGWKPRPAKGGSLPGDKPLDWPMSLIPPLELLWDRMRAKALTKRTVVSAGCSLLVLLVFRALLAPGCFSAALLGSGRRSPNRQQPDCPFTPIAPPKSARFCGRPFQCRKKVGRTFGEVLYCSDRCRNKSQGGLNATGGSTLALTCVRRIPA